MQINREKDCYAVVQGVENSYGYGHLYVYVFNAVPGMQEFRDAVRLDVTCQIGSSHCSGVSFVDDKSYAHRVGVTSLVGYEQMGLAQLKVGVKVMSKVDRHLSKMYDELGSPVDFADLATRVIRGAGAKTVHFHMHGEFHFDTRHESVTTTAHGGIGYVRQKISELEQSLIEKRRNAAA